MRQLHQTVSIITWHKGQRVVLNHGKFTKIIKKLFRVIMASRSESQDDDGVFTKNEKVYYS